MSRTGLIELPRRQNAFTLIEVLVAVLVLSIGLLGLASLHGVSLKRSREAALRTQASLLAYEIADAMRANRTKAASYAGTYAADSCNPDLARDGSDVVADDIAQWRNHLACLLPGGRGAIRISGSAPLSATIDVIWDEGSSGGDDDDTQTFTFITDL